MTERAPGLALPPRDFRYFNRAIKYVYGMPIEEIAPEHPSFAFEAMHLGLTALHTRPERLEIVHTSISPEGESALVARADRNKDGEEVFVDAVSHAMGVFVDDLNLRYLEHGEDFPISVVHNPGLIGRIRHQEPVLEIVAVIPRTEVSSERTGK